MKEIDSLVTQFFKKSWSDLHGNLNEIDGIKNPGVYALAYTEEDLCGRKVRPKDIVYIGMSISKAGVKGRLRQFKRAINQGSGHSAGNRVFKKCLKGGSFESKKRRKKFWVATLTLPCNVNKEERSPKGLRVMGKVACLEYYLIAHFRNSLRKEPCLNVK